MKTLLYQYAKDEDGKLIHIEDASSMHNYTCIECDKPLSIKAANSQKRRKHFSHRSNTSCDGEKYIHKIWKSRIRKAFYDNDSFMISYFALTPCDKVNTCKIKSYVKNAKCNIGFSQKVDLKKEYDTCEEEVEYKGFKGDLVLTDSKNPSKEPLFIEIYYTHPCDEVKIASGIRIIELKVTDDKMVPINLTEEFDPKIKELKLRNGTGNPYNIKPLPDIRFYNFNRMPYPNIGRFSFFKKQDGLWEMQYTSDFTCKKMPIRNCAAAFEVAIADDIVSMDRDNHCIESIMALAMKNGCAIRDCRLCHNKSYFEIYHKKCPVMTEEGFSSAKQCHDYKIGVPSFQRMVDRMRVLPHWIL